MPDDELGLADLMADDDWPDLVEWGIVDSGDEAEVLDPFEESEGFDDWEEDDEEED